MQDREGEARQRMVEYQLRARGVRDERVLAAMARVPRHLFVPAPNHHAAYEDHPLPIGDGQTISQPYMVAVMTEALRLEGGERVLEIGTGSGYQMAVLAELSAYVYSIERIGALAERARERLAGLGYGNVEITVGDGSLGWPEHAPYDRVLVTAGAPEILPTFSTVGCDWGTIALPAVVGGGIVRTIHSAASIASPARAAVKLAVMPRIGTSKPISANRRTWSPQFSCCRSSAVSAAGISLTFKRRTSWPLSSSMRI